MFACMNKENVFQIAKLSKSSDMILLAYHYYFHILYFQLFQTLLFVYLFVCLGFCFLLLLLLLLFCFVLFCFVFTSLQVDIHM